MELRCQSHLLLTCRPSVAVTGGVVCLHGNPASCTVVVHLASGEVLNWTGEGKGGMDDPAPSLTPRQLASGIPLKFPQPCGKIELAWYKDKVCVCLYHFVLFLLSTCVMRLKCQLGLDVVDI